VAINYHQPVDSTGYKTVAASTTGATLTGTGGAAVAGGAGGAQGDFLNYLIVTPTTTSPGSIAILDGATSITVFAGGASALLSLVPFTIPIGFLSANGAWTITTGSGLSLIAVGQYT